MKGVRMKKKIINAMLIIAMVSSICACGNKKDNNKEIPEKEEPVKIEDNKPVEESAPDEKTGEESKDVNTEDYGDPVPGTEIDLSFIDEVRYSYADYNSIADCGTASEEDIMHVEEGFYDMCAAAEEDFLGDCLWYFYGNGTAQEVCPDDGDGARIIKTSVSTGNPEMDGIMNRVGYEEYEVTYLYTYGIWKDKEETINVPVCVNLTIADKEYMYLFAGGELIKRSGPEGDSINPKTNEFINDIYRLGCFYGDVINTERGRYSITLYTSDSIKPKGDNFVILTSIDGVTGAYMLVVDEDTKFSEDCACEFFEGYEEGDLPVEWMRKAYADEEGSTALLGVFDIKVTGNHVDYFYGSYWWD